MEAYNYKTNEWLYVASMNTRRSSVGVGVVEGETETPETRFLGLCVTGLADGSQRVCR